ncbi:MAG: VirB3 family type IV secretion system protein [Lautropia sp.]
MTPPDGRPLADPIFKGCTRPPMLAGVPMFWMVVPAGIVLLLSPYLLYLLSPVAVLVLWMVFIPFYLWMRAVTRLDDQRLPQIALRLWIRARQPRSRRYWGSLCYSPSRYKRHEKHR